MNNKSIHIDDLILENDTIISRLFNISFNTFEFNLTALCTIYKIQNIFLEFHNESDFEYKNISLIFLEHF